MTVLHFVPLRIEQEKDLILKFRADSFVASFGNADLFFGEDGKGADRYLDILRKRNKLEGACVHVLLNSQIIGQIEMRPDIDHDLAGYVNLFYLIPEFRSRGLGSQLESYAVNFFRSLKYTQAFLNVAPGNTLALRFYAKCGWIKHDRIQKNGTDILVLKKLL